MQNSIIKFIPIRPVIINGNTAEASSDQKAAMLSKKNTRQPSMKTPELTIGAVIAAHVIAA